MEKVQPHRVHAESSRRGKRRLAALGLLPVPLSMRLRSSQVLGMASSGVVSKRKLLQNAVRDLSTTLCRGITQHVLATVPLRASLNAHLVVGRLPLPTDDLIPPTPLLGSPPPPPVLLGRYPIRSSLPSLLGPSPKKNAAPTPPPSPATRSLP